MVLLTIKTESQSAEVKKFDQNRISIGGLHADLQLEVQLDRDHLIIQRLGNRYLLINHANDPFVTLNGMPFGKKSLKNGDIIQLGDYEILFEAESEVEAIEDDQSLDELIKQTEALPLAQTRLFEAESAEEPNKILHKNLKEVESLREETISYSVRNTFTLKRVIWGFVAVLLLSIFAAGNFYFIMTEKTDIQEIKAAQTMADTAMALMNAQLQHNKPANQNWSNPDFLKGNLATILSEGYEPILDIDAQGKFVNYPYILRIYTSSDMSQFLLIAQPAPTFFQWIIPRTTLVIDSRDMRVRQTKELRSLNRLLVNPNILDQNNSLEISTLIEQGRIIPLDTLAMNHPEFAPPKELAFVRSGAEDYIYNAPRYHKFNEGIINKAIYLSLYPNHTQSIAPLLQEISILSKLPDMVLFAPKGLEEAMMIQQGLMPFAPREGFLVGYLSVDPNTKKIANSHLVLVANQFAKASPPKETHAVLSMSENTPNSDDPGLVGVNIQHPLYKELTALYAMRQKELCAHHDEIIELINNHTQKGAINFSDRLHPLLHQYQDKCEELHDKAEETLLKLYHDYVETGPKFPPPLFIAYVEAAGVESFLHDSIRIQAKLHLGHISTEELLEKLSAKINESNDLVHLDQAVEEAATLLTQHQFPDSHMLALQQNKMRMAVIQKLEQLLLFPNQHNSKDIFHPKNRWVVLRILKNGRITDPDEREFYLKQFDTISMRR